MALHAFPRRSVEVPATSSLDSFPINPLPVWSTLGIRSRDELCAVPSLPSSGSPQENLQGPKNIQLRGRLRTENGFGSQSQMLVGIPVDGKGSMAEGTRSPQGNQEGMEQNETHTGLNANKGSSPTPEMAALQAQSKLQCITGCFSLTGTKSHPHKWIYARYVVKCLSEVWTRYSTKDPCNLLRISRLSGDGFYTWHFIDNEVGWTCSSLMINKGLLQHYKRAKCFDLLNCKRGIKNQRG